MKQPRLLFARPRRTAPLACAVPWDRHVKEASVPKLNRVIGHIARRARGTQWRRPRRYCGVLLILVLAGWSAFAGGDFNPHSDSCVGPSRVEHEGMRLHLLSAQVDGQPVAFPDASFGSLVSASGAGDGGADQIEADLPGLDGGQRVFYFGRSK
jgi:hypothetical protein